jgi:repressor LexA
MTFLRLPAATLKATPPTTTASAVPPQLTDTQREVLSFILNQQARTGLFPTLREISAHFGYASPFAATRHIQALEKKGALSRVPGKARAFTTPALTTLGVSLQRLRRIPLFGLIPAGLPVTTDSVGATADSADEHLAIDPAAFGVNERQAIYALRVRGDSMIEAQINDGDVVFLTPGQPRSGQIVAALIDGETTLKRFLIEKGRAFLRAENPRYPDLVPAAELSIQGLMVGLLRGVNGAVRATA